MIKYYLLCDDLTDDDLWAFQAHLTAMVDVAARAGGVLGNSIRVRAKKTLEFRPPEKGEWYLSGAVPGAYRAEADLDHAYRILCLVATRVVEVEIEKAAGD